VTLTNVTSRLTHEFMAHSGELYNIRSLVRRAADESGCSEGCSELVVIAVNEAIMNIIQHGYQSNPKGNITIKIKQADNALIIQLRDFAETVDPAKIKPRDLGNIRPGGLGTHFIREAMDDIKFLSPPDGVGNLLQMIKHIT
jgi:anti-sigma regulatory factor (Ser/Thr protein kinase)